MWIVAKIKTNNLNIFISEMKKKIKDIKIYYPKILCKKKHQNILGDYIFCYHNKFKDNFHSHFKYIRGLIYFLEKNKCNQDDLLNFIKYCNINEDSDGFLKSSFLKKKISGNGQFINGPFSNYLFEVAAKEKNKLKVFIGNFKINISDKNNILYQKI